MPGNRKQQSANLPQGSSYSGMSNLPASQDIYECSLNTCVKDSVMSYYQEAGHILAVIRMWGAGHNYNIISYNSVS